MVITSPGVRIPLPPPIGTSFAFRTRRSQNMTDEPLFIGAFNHS